MVPRLTIRFVSTHLQKDFNDIKCQQVPDDDVAETAEGHTFAQSNKRQGRATQTSPEQKARFAQTKISKTAARYTLYTLMSAMFSQRNFICLKGLPSTPANQGSQTYKDIHWKQAKGP